MQANILEGVYIRVGGEAGKTKGLSLNILEDMFKHLQDLITSLAKYELETKGSPNLKAFELELFDFKPGSAVPAFRLITEPQKELIPILTEQRIVVADKFDKLMSIADHGSYESFFPKETLPEVRYEIGEELYGLTIAAGNSPISIVKPIKNKLDFTEIYKVNRFTKEQGEYLLRPRVKRNKNEDPEEILGLIQRVGKRRKIIDLYESKDAILSIAPPQIVLDSKIYQLHTPLVCIVQKEEDHFIIENEMLDLYGSGVTIDEAELDLYKEFDESFQLLNSLPDNELSERLKRAKIMINSYVKEIIE